jgi:hypothetical protein
MPNSNASSLKLVGYKLFVIIAVLESGAELVSMLPFFNEGEEELVLSLDKGLRERRV